MNTIQDLVTINSNRDFAIARAAEQVHKLFSTLVGHSADYPADLVFDDPEVARQFIENIRERAVGQSVMKSLTPGQTVIKIVLGFYESPAGRVARWANRARSGRARPVEKG